MKFLIDECLAPSLVRHAIEAGYHASGHVVHRGMQGWKDHQIMKVLIEQDWTFVTRNSNDFRPRSGSRSEAPCYVGVELHAGLVCLNLPAGSAAKQQEAYFRAALAALGSESDLTNQVLEVWPDTDDPGSVVVERYDFPDEDEGE
ncbi:DUF5615 family PIN-like protein [Limimaricola sp. G21655-S1]|uniref:DUF5615 family PIN-like protein n=1 Tax=Limimaricola sp. G21655-S1 TaxID=3014768 RepID=UPI0022AE9D25|nr:DUF5615 family PIN-like protein [Limimaricola sp. G21655-S1]